MDPIFQDKDDGLWYFWDEVWANRLGPYPTWEEAKIGLQEYTLYLDGRPNNFTGFRGE